MMEYLKSKRGKSPAPPAVADTPVLNEEDEEFLHRIAEEGPPPPLPARPGTQDLPEAGNPEGNNAQMVLYEGAQLIPETPDNLDSEFADAESHENVTKMEKEHRKKSKWSFLRRDSRDSKRKATASGLMSAVENVKSPNAQPNEDDVVSDHEAHNEEAEMTDVLEQLNLAAVNNRVFSVSKESRELLQQFTLVLKDLVNGVPTAYGDLESLLKNSEDQLQRGFIHLPPWLQKLIEQLPEKMSKSFGPEVLAAAAEKHGVSSKYANLAARGAEKAGVKIKTPSLKDLVTKPGAVAGLLKTIMNFLKLRFPAFLGMNVLYSLALFVLLLVFWYCHKRGREVRLGKEQALLEEEVSKLSEDAQCSSSSAQPTTPLSESAPAQKPEADQMPVEPGDVPHRRSTSRTSGTKDAERASSAHSEPGKKADKEAG